MPAGGGGAVRREEGQGRRCYPLQENPGGAAPAAGLGGGGWQGGSGLQSRWGLYRALSEQPRWAPKGPAGGI